MQVIFHEDRYTILDISKEESDKIKIMEPSSSYRSPREKLKNVGTRTKEYIIKALSPEARTLFEKAFK